MFKIAVVAFLFTPCAQADDLSQRWGLGAAGALDVPLGSRMLRDTADPGAGLGLWLRRGITERWGVGLAYDNIGFEKTHARLQPVTANAFYQLVPKSRLNPNLHAGVGIARIDDMENTRSEGFAAKLGAGLDWFFCPYFSVGASVDYHLIAKNSRRGHEGHALVSGLTAGFWFGGHAPAAPVAAAAPAKLTPVAPAAPVAQPQTVAAPVVPQDSDKDGVVDADDRCPGSPAGSKVNAFGCPVEEKVAIDLNVQFDTNQDIVKPEYDARLREVADFLKKYAGATAVIEGHTDNQGKAEANKALSQRRADAVRKALIDRFGVEGARLQAAGFGQEKPIADNGTLSGRASNRRVVAVFSSQR
ncbi:MAG: OmpA family protein [Elusimicrobiota bacterium]